MGRHLPELPAAILESLESLIVVSRSMERTTRMLRTSAGESVPRLRPVRMARREQSEMSESVYESDGAWVEVELLLKEAQITERKSSSVKLAKPEIVHTTSAR